MAAVLSPPLSGTTTWGSIGRALVHASPIALAIVLVAAALYAAQLVLLSTEPAYQLLPIDTRESTTLLGGVHDIEQDQRGPFRWSNGSTVMSWYPRGAGEHTALSLQLGPPPPTMVGTPVQLSVEGQVIAQWMVDARPRRYHILQPRSPASARITAALTGAVVAVPPDTRSVSVRIEAIALQSIGERVWPTMSMVLFQTLTLALGAGLLSVLVRRRWVILGITLIGGALGAAFVLQPLLYTPYVVRLMIALAGLLLVTCVALPRFMHTIAWAGPASFARVLLGLAILACMVRLIGSLYPLFRAYDLPLNLERFVRVTQGNLVAFNESFEFQGGMTVYPAGPYLLLLPGLLVGLAPELIVQVGVALLDGFSVVFVALLARRLGTSQRAALLAGFLAALMPISLTSLYYGHTAQIVGQMLMAPLALLLMSALRQPYRVVYWVGAGTVLSAALLSHIGVTVLAVAWMGLVWVLLSVRWREYPTAWRWLTLMLVLSIGMSMLFVYAPVVEMHLNQLASIGAEAAQAKQLPAYNLIAKAYWIAYTPLGILLFVPGLALLAKGMPREGRVVTWCWVGAAAAFAAVELISGLQVRFLVFLAPLVAVASGVVFDRTASYGQWGRLAVFVAISVWFVQSTLAWYSGTFLNVAPSMVPLLR